MKDFKIGDTVYVVESNKRVVEMIIVNISGNLYLLRYKNGQGGYRVPKHRLFKSIEDTGIAYDEKMIRPPQWH